MQDETRGKLDEIADKKQNLLLERAQIAIDLTIALERSLQMQEEITELEIQWIEAESELEAVNAESERVREMLDSRKAEIRAYEKDIAQLTEQCKKIFAAVQKSQEELAANPRSDDILEIMSRWTNNENLDTGEPVAEGEDESRKLEDLDAEIIRTNTSLDLLRGGNPRAIQQFEDRAKQIEELKDKIINFEANLAALTENINEIRGQWEPELDEIVSQISAAFARNFERIGCAGQVSVKKDEEDFREWTIQIEVKFRYVISYSLRKAPLTQQQRE